MMENSNLDVLEMNLSLRGLEEFKQLFDKYQFMFKCPRLYLSNHFSDLKQKVDSAFNQKLFNRPDEKIKFNLTQNWLEIIEYIESFEKDCLAKKKTNKFNEEITNGYKQTIETIVADLNQTGGIITNKNLKILYKKIHELNEILFLKKTMSFVFKKQLEEPIEKNFTNNFFKEMDWNTTVGKLIATNFDYFSDKEILEAYFQELKNDLNETKSKLIKLLQLEQKMKIDIKPNQIHEIIFDEFLICSYKFHLNITNEDLKLLPDAKKVHLRLYDHIKLDGNLFKNCDRLNEISLFYKDLSDLDADFLKDVTNLEHIDLRYCYLSDLKLFKFNNKLKKITLSDNELDFLDKEMFCGLDKLNSIDFFHNNLEFITKDVLHGLPNLKVINLRYNKIIQLDEDIFKKVINLKEIDLSINQLTEIHPQIFKNCLCLKKINLSTNKLEAIDKDIFKGLSNLESIDLSANRIEFLDKNIFMYSTRLVIVDLTSNCFSQSVEFKLNGNYNTLIRI